MALRLRDAGGANVTVQVAAVGPKGTGRVLREALSLGADRARLVTSESDSLAPDSAAYALTTALRNEAKFDLILTGGGGDTDEGLMARLAGAALGVAYAGKTAHLAVRQTEGEADLVLSDETGRQRVRALPALVGVEAGMPLRVFTIDGYLSGLAKNVE